MLKGEPGYWKEKKNKVRDLGSATGEGAGQLQFKGDT